MITVTTNVASLLARRNLSKSTNSLNTAIERLTTGYRINSAKDDAAGTGITIDMDVKLSSNEVVQNNVEMGVSLLNTAEGNLNLIKDKVQRCRNLCEQALNGTYDSDSQEAINTELGQLVDTVNNVRETTKFNGINLFANGEVNPVRSTGFIASVETQNATVTIDATATTVAEAESALRTALSSSGIIGISNELGLQALANVVNGTNDTANNCSGKTIVLTDDIDLGSISNWTPIGTNASRNFSGTFNGNGHTVSNMTCSGNQYLGLFGYARRGTLSNTGVVNASVSGTNYVGGLVGETDTSLAITNCYVIGNISGELSVGGLVGDLRQSSVIDSYAAGTVSGDYCIGGLIGITFEASVTRSNAYTTTSGTLEIGGFVGRKNGTNTFTGNTYIDDSTGQAVGNVDGDVGGITLLETPKINLQIGADGTENSRLNVSFDLNLWALNSILTSPSSRGNLATLDSILSNITKVETQIGVGLNRLESVQESLQTQQKTLTAARSVVKDADVSQESARFIRSQILQQASASLLTVANQSPSLLLSLVNGMTR